jgi:hypothetical protein
MKNRAATHVVIPICRAFRMMFRSLHLCSYSRCARFARSLTRRPRLFLTFSQLLISTSRTLAADIPVIFRSSAVRQARNPCG